MPPSSGSEEGGHPEDSADSSHVLRPGYLEPGADELSTVAPSSKGITARAIANADPKQSDFGPAA